MTVLDITGAGKKFGALQALYDVTVSVSEGSFHGLIGPNGSGKSTLLKAIAGEHFLDAGTIKFDGQDITKVGPSQRARSGMSIKFQITAVMDSLTVYDNLLLALQAGNSLDILFLSKSRGALHRQIVDQLAAFQLSDRMYDLAGTLSHGQQQWLEIAMALAAEPRLLLLDEPTAGMSPQERHATAALLKPLRGHCALVIVEHDLEFIKDLCDHLTVLDGGRLLDHGTVKQIERSLKVKEIYTRRV
jgi:branched-chain amino acid transport system ATP-binding protein